MPIKRVLNEEIDYLQILDQDGNLDKELEPQLSNEDLIRLYRAMWLAREGDQRLLKLQRQGRIGTFGPSTGQEAPGCAAVLAMRKTDWFITALREYGGRLMRGEPLVNSMLLWNGITEGHVFKGNERTLPFTVVIGSQLPPAVGIAYAMRLKGEKETCVVAFLGDGATSEGDFHEAMNLASVWQVPVIFIVQNNHWAISTPTKLQTHSRTFAQKAIAYDMPGIQVDGNDALVVYKVVKDALERGRSGGGPTFIECITYRMEPHTTADDPTKYRSQDEVEEWRKRDPLTRFKIYLNNKGIWNDEKQAKMEEEIKAEIDEAVRQFESMTDFKPDIQFDHIFGTKIPMIEEQRAEFLEELRKEAEANG